MKGSDDSLALGDCVEEEDEETRAFRQLEEEMEAVAETLKPLISDLDALNERRFVNGANIKAVETKLIELERSEVSLNKNLEETRAEVQGDTQNQLGLVEKQRELATRLKECQIRRESVAAELLRSRNDSKQLEETLVELIRTASELDERQGDLVVKRDACVENVVQATALLKRKAHRLQDTRRHVTMIEHELIAMSKRARSRDASKPPPKSDAQQSLEKRLSVVRAQAQALNKERKVQQKLIASLQKEAAELNRVHNQNHTRSEAIKAVHIPEMNSMNSRLKRAEVALEQDAESLEQEEKSLQDKETQVARIISTIEKREARLTSVLEDLETQVKELEPKKHALQKRLSALKKHLNHLDGEKHKLTAQVDLASCKNDELYQRKHELELDYGRSTSGPHKSSNKPIPCAVDITHQDGKVTRKGMLTVTAFLVICETEALDGETIEDTFKFCVEMPEVLDALVFAKQEEDGTTGSRLQLCFKPGYKNIFLFNEETGDVDKNENAKCRIIFGGDKNKLEEVCACLRHNIAQNQALGVTSQLRRGGGGSKVDVTDFLVPETHKGPYRARMNTSGGKNVRIEGESEIVTFEQLKRVVRSLPPRYSLDKWVLIYSISRDGTSMKRFFESCEAAQSTASLIVIRDADGEVFGGFSTATWAVQKGFYGNADSFVFAFDQKGSFTKYGWSGLNDFYQLCNKDQIAFGGGGNFAFSCQSNLSKGTSGPCSTYECPRLTTTDMFECRLFEVWSPVNIHLL